MTKIISTLSVYHTMYIVINVWQWKGYVLGSLFNHHELLSSDCLSSLFVNQAWIWLWSWPLVTGCCFSWLLAVVPRGYWLLFLVVTGCWSSWLLAVVPRGYWPLFLVVTGCCSSWLLAVVPCASWIVTSAKRLHSPNPFFRSSALLSIPPNISVCNSPSCLVC